MEEADSKWRSKLRIIDIFLVVVVVSLFNMKDVEFGFLIGFRVIQSEVSD